MECSNHFHFSIFNRTGDPVSIKPSMPWTTKDYPPSLKNLMAPVRNKAIDVANTLLDEGYEEGRAIAIATAKAEEWGENRGKKIRKDKAS